MSPGQAKRGSLVYFSKERGYPDEPAIRIVRGEVEQIIWPGTTNEYFNVKVVDVESGTVLSLVKSPADCSFTQQEARNAAKSKIYEKLDFLREQLTALGDHTFTPSRWSGN